MTKPPLTVERLIQGGFGEVGCWELNDARDLTHKIDLPTRAGIYAFATDGLVKYVGLASKSLRRRLGFYRKPGVSQRTNVRLNELIRGHIEKATVVQILTAYPADYDWNGFRIRGAEGLEAGLIAEFNLPWNVRGTSRIEAVEQPMNRQSGVRGRIIELVRERPDITELAIAKAIYGPKAVQQKVNQQCRSLAQLGMLIRRGRGGVSDPFVYRLGNL